MISFTFLSETYICILYKMNSTLWVLKSTETVSSKFKLQVYVNFYCGLGLEEEGPTLTNKIAHIPHAHL